jgi:ion channel-forming bestrophin family protein
LLTDIVRSSRECDLTLVDFDFRVGIHRRDTAAVFNHARETAARHFFRKKADIVVNSTGEVPIVRPRASPVSPLWNHTHPAIRLLAQLSSLLLGASESNSSGIRMSYRGFFVEVFSSKTLSRVAVYALLIALYSVLPVWIETQTSYTEFIELPTEVHAALTLVLGWLLVFRTNSSYERWWEARTLWGSLINASRNLAIKVADLVRSPNRDLIRFRTDIIVFAVALKDHLRTGATLQDLDGFHDCKDTPVHVPAYLVTRMYEEFAAWKADGIIDGDELRVLDLEAHRLLDICGGCERIRTTLLARSYRAFARQCVFLVLATLPWGIVDAFRWWTIPLTGIVSYFMLGLETVAEHVEEPFGQDEDDLDLESLCRTIDTSVREIFARRLSRNSPADSLQHDETT